jgi:hypothetical protein
VRPLPQNRSSTSGTVAAAGIDQGLQNQHRADGDRTCTTPAPGHSGSAAWWAASAVRAGRAHRRTVARMERQPSDLGPRHHPLIARFEDWKGQGPAIAVCQATAGDHR